MHPLVPTAPPLGSTGPRRTDVLVIGAGHNGLVAAAYLAKAGMSVQVVEASPGIGGMISTNPIFPDAPGHQINEGGIQASLFRSSGIEDHLDLKKYGFKQIIADPFHVHLDPEGPSLAFWHDPAKTVEELRYFSPKDARAYEAFARSLDAAMDVAIPYMNSHPLRPSGAMMREVLPAALKKRKELLPLTTFLTTSHREFIEERFDSPLLRAALASMPPFCWMTQDGTAWALIYVAMCHRTNSARFQGGTGALTNAVAQSLIENGGSIRVNSRVQELITRGSEVVGVRLENGEELYAETTLASCSPKATLARLLPDGMMPDHLERRAKAIPTNVLETTTVKIDVAVSGRLTMPKHTSWRADKLDLTGPIVSWQTYEDHIDAWNSAVQRKYPQNECFIGIVPSRLDPTQAPEGQDTFWAWSGIFPRNPDIPWSDVKDEVCAKMLKESSLYYDGLESMEISRRIMSAPELEERFNVPDGNVYHVEPVGMRFGGLRPAQGFGGYETPVPGLWITGAGTHPTGGISGLPGKNAAEALIRAKQGSGLIGRLRRG